MLTNPAVQRFETQSLLAILLFGIVFLCGCETKANPLADHDVILVKKTSSGIEECRDFRTLSVAREAIESLAETYNLRSVRTPPGVVPSEVDRYLSEYERHVWTITDGDHVDTIILSLNRNHQVSDGGLDIEPMEKTFLIFVQKRTLSKKTKKFLPELIIRIRRESSIEGLDWGDRYEFFMS